MVLLPAPGEQRPGRSRLLLDDPVVGQVRRSVTTGGARVVTQAMPGVRSATIGIAVPVGSRDESAKAAGASHFLEHLLFKGTSRRSALEISAAIEAVGGDLNAFTSKEYTCFYARVLDRDAELALDVLLDMISDSLISSADLEVERGVVLEEIAMGEDDPAGLAMEMAGSQIFAGSPLAAPVIGSTASISQMSRRLVTGHYRRWYRPGNLAVVAAGAVDHRRVVRAAEKALGGTPVDPESASNNRRTVRRRPPRPAPSAKVRQRDTEQANIVVGYPGVAKADDDRYALGVLNASLGGGMSSRLFQTVREQRGLVYSVHSFASMYSDAGAFGVYAGTSPAKLGDTAEVIFESLGEVARNGMTVDEVERGRGQLRGSVVLAQEEPGARLTTLAEAELITGELRSLDDSLRLIDAVTPEAVRDVAARVLNQPRQVSVVGPFDDGDVSGWEQL